MDLQINEDKPRPERGFHALFIFLLVSCFVFIGVSIFSSPYEPCPHCLFEPRGIAGQVAGVLVFTGLTGGLIWSRSHAKKLALDRGGVLAATEKWMFVEGKWSTSLLIWTLGIALFFMMAEPKDAAIFLMAVIAIYVAVEHLVGLHEQHDLISRQEIIAKDQEKVLEDYARKLSSLANAVGLESGRREIYTAYKGENEKIMAIVHFFDIDMQWFNAADEEKDYKALMETLTFYNSLRNVREALFVADLPFPRVKDGPHPASDAEMADQFNNLLGLAWQWRMLDEIAKENEAKGKTSKFDIRIAATSNWIHVTNERVYQVIPGSVPSETRVRDLTIDLAEDDAQLISLRAWAKQEICEAAERGSSGEEFLCAAIFNQVLSRYGASPDHGTLARSGLEEILTKFGMSEWIERRENYVRGLKKDKDELKERCLDIFEKFLVAVTDEEQAAANLSTALRERLEGNHSHGRETYICQHLFIGREVM